jgi:hypothetical protein
MTERRLLSDLYDENIAIQQINKESRCSSGGTKLSG